MSRLRKPLSRIFARKKSRASLQPESASSTPYPSEAARSPSPGKAHATSSFSGASRQASPEMRYRSVFEDEGSVARNRLSSISCLPGESSDKKSQLAEEPQKVKKKGSFSALSALFRPRSQSVAPRPASPIKAPASPIKKAFERTYTPESLPPLLPLSPESARSPSSLGQLFDLAQADAEAVLADATPALTFYSPAMASSRQSLFAPEPSRHSIAKSRSTPELHGHARKSSMAATAIKSKVEHLRSPRLGAPSVPSSPFLSSRLPLPVATPLSPRLPVSPSPSAVAIPIRAPQSSHSAYRGGARSPTPPTIAESTSSQPPFYNNVKASLIEGLLERNDDGDLDASVRPIKPSNATSLPYVARPTPPSPEKASLVPLSSVHRKSQQRPTTAGTFGRPGTGNHPDTANSAFGRPATGVDSLRPDTAVSIGNLASATRVRIASKPRFRRISDLDLGLDEEYEGQSDELANGDRVSLRGYLDEGDASTGQQRDLDLSAGMIRDDSGFTDGHSGSLRPSREGDKLPSHAPLVSPSSLSLFSAEHRDPPRVLSKSSLRPTTANTIPFPSPDDSEVESAFNPKNSLGSIARQSTVSILSDFERSWDERMSDLERREQEEEQRRARLNSTLSILESAQPGRDPLFGSIVQKRISQFRASDKALDADSTPTKPKDASILSQETPSVSPIISKRFGTAEESRKIIGRESTSSSLLSRIQARRHLEDSIFLKHTLTMSRAFAIVPRETREASTQTEATAMSDEQLNSSHDPFTGSYFPPVQSLGVKPRVDSPRKARHQRSRSFFVKHEQSATSSEAEKDRSIDELQEKLEDALRKIEMLEYALATH